jgi:hypothetical protein
MYAEASYFEGFHFAHIAAYEEELRLRRIRRVSARLVERRTGSRGRR